jgi:hypothetical protein
MSSGEEKSTSKTGYYKLMLYAAIFGAVASLVTTGYITLYNQGNKFFGQHSVNLYNINFWPLILLGGAGVFMALPSSSLDSTVDKESLKPNMRKPVASTTVNYQAYFFKDL